MSAEDDPGALRNLIQLLDEDRSRCSKLLNNVPVMDDFLSNINRRAEQVEGNSYYIDGPYNAGAKSARTEQDDFLPRVRHVKPNYSNTLDRQRDNEL